MLPGNITLASAHQNSWGWRGHQGTGPGDIILEPNLQVHYWLYIATLLALYSNIIYWLYIATCHGLMWSMWAVQCPGGVIVIS